MKNYKRKLDFLLAEGILQCDESYMTTQRSLKGYSKGYRIADKYLSQPGKEVVSTAPEFVFPDNVKEKYPYLITPFDQLEFDFPSAVAFIKSQPDKYVAGTRKYNHAMRACMKLRDKQWNVRLDDQPGKGQRLYSEITLASKCLRKFLKHDGEELVELDLKNSQLYFSIIVIQNYVKEIQEKKEVKHEYPFHNSQSSSNNSNQSSTSFHNHNSNISTSLSKFNPSSVFCYVTTDNQTLTDKGFEGVSQTEQNHQNSSFSRDSNMLRPLPENSSNSSHSYMLRPEDSYMLRPDIELYCDLVMSGKIYEYVAAKIKEELGIVYDTRKELKTVVFRALFSDNRFAGDKMKKYWEDGEQVEIDPRPKMVFKKYFPSVYQIFYDIKRKDNFPILLHQIESHAVLNIAARAITSTGIPVFTIHDCLMTTKGHFQSVYDIMLREFTSMTGVTPSIDMPMAEIQPIIEQPANQPDEYDRYYQEVFDTYYLNDLTLPMIMEWAREVGLNNEVYLMRALKECKVVWQRE